MNELEFQPVPSLARVFSADPALHRFIFLLGPVGSTKTTTVLFFLLAKAAMQEPSPDGYRRTRFAVIRSTVTSLIQTALKDILNLFGEIAEWRPSTRTVHIEVGDIKSEWLLLPLETPDDQKRLLSLQLSAVFINEAREISWDLLQQAFSRTGRYPSGKAGGVNCTHRFIVCDSNLGVEGSPMHTFLEETKSPRTLYILQPDALSPQADWLQFLPENYYQDAMIGATAQWIRQHVRAMWGLDLSGEPVYGGSFSRSWHVAQERLKPAPGRPLVLGVDPGLNPAVVVTQLSPTGQLRVLKEFHAPNILFRQFLDAFVVPELQALYPLQDMLWIMDPAGSSRTAMTADTALGVLKAYGFTVFTSHTNDLPPRLRSVERWLLQASIVNSSFAEGVGHPALLVDPSCKALIDGFEGKYRYMRDSKGELNPKPEKKHPVSDVHDCLQYVCLGLSGRRIAREAGRNPANDGLAPTSRLQAGTTGQPPSRPLAWRGK